MEEKTMDALKWIATIFNDNNIPYRIGGGFATHLYGATRPVHDIDISVSGTYFPTIIPLVTDYITAGPKHYENEKWNCNTLSLEYYGQEIDLTDVDTLLMSNKAQTKWIKNKDIYSKHPDVTMDIDGTKVSLMHPRVIIEYKQEMEGDHHTQDLKVLENYTQLHNL